MRGCNLQRDDKKLHKKAGGLNRERNEERGRGGLEKKTRDVGVRKGGLGEETQGLRRGWNAKKGVNPEIV